MDLTKEIQFLRELVVSDPNTIARTHLAGSDQIRQRVYEQTLDGSFQMTGSVSRICAFRQQKVPRRFRDRQGKRLRRGHLNSASDCVQFEIENASECLDPQRPEHHDLVEAVDELGSELSASSLCSHARNALI